METKEFKPRPLAPMTKNARECDHTPKEVFIRGAIRLMCNCGRWHGDKPLKS